MEPFSIHACPRFTGWAVLYTDEGPTGITGQSMDITCPHAYVVLCPDSEAAQRIAATLGRAGKRRQVRILDPEGRSGVWSAAGVTLEPSDVPRVVAPVAAPPQG